MVTINTKQTPGCTFCTMQIRIKSVVIIQLYYIYIRNKFNIWLSPVFLKNKANEIATMLTHLFQQLPTHGTLPSAWKHTYTVAIFPILKKGNKSDPRNCQPVSLTVVLHSQTAIFSFKLGRGKIGSGTLT